MKYGVYYSRYLDAIMILSGVSYNSSIKSYIVHILEFDEGFICSLAIEKDRFEKDYFYLGEL